MNRAEAWGRNTISKSIRTEPQIPPFFPTGSLIVVGNINRDIKTSSLVAGPQLFRDGETSLEAVGETIGGGGANSACMAAALGANTAFAGTIGDDALGRRLRRALRASRVSPHLSVARGVETGTSINLAFASGHRHFLSWLPNNQRLRCEDLPLAALGRYRHLLRADIWFSEAMLFEGNARLLRAARERGLRTSLDLNFDPQARRAKPAAVEARKRAVREVLPLINLAHGNAVELRQFAGSADLKRSLRKILDWGVEAVVVHLGEKGAGYYSAAGWVTAPAALVPRPVQRTGSGDLLSVCMILSEGMDEPGARLRRANRIVGEFMAGRLSLLPHLES